MSSPSRPSKALERLWYDKLKEEGFEDIEDASPSRHLKCWHSFKFPAINEEQREATTRYIDAALSLLHRHKFKKPIERAIWEMHCNGKSHREIEAVISTSRFKKKYKRQAILNVITQIALKITYD